MGIVAIITMGIFVIGLLILSSDIEFIGKIYTKLEQFLFPQNKNDPKMRSLLLIIFIGHLTIFYFLILIFIELISFVQNL